MTIDNRPTELLRYKTCKCLFCDHWLPPISPKHGQASPRTMTVYYTDDKTTEITSITQERNHSA